MLAMALIVVMPVLSRSLPMASMPGMGDDCPHHQVAGSKHPSAPHAPADPMARCGYCVLFQHSPVLASGVAVPRVPGAPVAVHASILRAGEKPATPRLSADPRGPPISA